MVHSSPPRPGRALPGLIATLAFGLVMAGAAPAPAASIHKVRMARARPHVVHPFGHHRATPKLAGPLAARRATPKAFAAVTKIALGTDGSAEGSCCVDPPEVSCAVGNPQKIQVDTLGISVFNRQGVLQRRTLWPSFCGYLSGPVQARVLWDALSSRFVAVAQGGSNSLCLMASGTSDALGGWVTYNLPVPLGAPGTYVARPTLGLDDDAILMTYDLYDSTGNYTSSSVFAASKSVIYHSLGLAASVFQNLAGPVTPPVVRDNASLYDFFLAAPPAGTALHLYAGLALQRRAGSITARPDVAVTAYAPPPAALMPNTAATLSAGTAAFDGPSTQIGDRLVNANGVDLGGRAGIRWYEINTSSSTLAAGGLAQESGTSDDIWPTVAASTSHAVAGSPVGDVFMTWTSVDARGAFAGRHAPRMVVGTHVPGDGTTITSRTAKQGVNYTPAPDSNNWGRSSVTLDPVAHAGCPDGSWAVAVGPVAPTTNQWGGFLQHFSTC